MPNQEYNITLKFNLKNAKVFKDVAKVSERITKSFSGAFKFQAIEIKNISKSIQKLSKSVDSFSPKQESLESLKKVNKEIKSISKNATNLVALFANFKPDKIVEKFIEALKKVVIAAEESAAQSTTTFTERFLNGIENKLLPALILKISGAALLISGIFTGPRLFTGIFTGVSGALDKTENKISAFFGTISGNLKSLASGEFSAIFNLFSNRIDGLLSSVGSFLDIFVEFKKGVISFTDFLLGATLPAVNSIGNAFVIILHSKLLQILIKRIFIPLKKSKRSKSSLRFYPEFYKPKKFIF